MPPRKLTPAELASLWGRAIESQVQFYVARTSGGQPGQFLQAGDIQARCMEPVPPGQVILVKYGQEWRAFAPRNPAPVARVVQDVRRRQVVPVVLCETLRVAFLYRVIAEDKSQEIWLSDFSGKSHLVKSIPFAIDYGDMTYQVQYTIPAYTWKRYDVTCAFRRNLPDGTIYIDNEPLIGSFQIWDMTHPDLDYLDDSIYPDSGTVEAATITGTRRYTCDHPPGTPPPAPMTGTGEVSMVDTIIPRYNLADNGFSGATPIRPSPSNFTRDSDPDIDPYQVAFGSLPDTGDTHPALLDGYGEGVAILTPYYYADEDNFYWGSPSGLLLTNPGGFGQDNPDFRGMVTIASVRHRVFDGGYTFSIPAGQSRPEPINAVAQVETYLSHSNGRLQVLIKNSSRPNGELPGQNCQPGDPDDDYFLEVGQYELVAGEIQEVEVDGLPNWMSALSAPNRIDQIKNDLLQDTIPNEVIFFVVDTLPNKESHDWFVSDESFIKVGSGVETVYGWEVQTDLTKAQIKNLVLGTVAEVDEGRKYTYYISPIQIDLERLPEDNRIDVGGGDGEGIAALPFVGGLGTQRASLKVRTPPEIAELDPSSLEILNSVTSWSDNTFEHCLTTNNVVSINVGGS